MNEHIGRELRQQVSNEVCIGRSVKIELTETEDRTLLGELGCTPSSAQDEDELKSTKGNV